MPATREQLLARWETPEGLQLAEKVCRAFDPVRSGQHIFNFTSSRTLDAALLAQVAALPFADEVRPAIDLRGLHVGSSDPDIGIKYIDISHMRFDYAYEIDRIIRCRTDGAIFDGCHSINGMFEDSALTGISFVGASLNGGSFLSSDLRESNLQGASLVKADLSRTKCIGTTFLGADMRFADIRYADLSDADLREANLTEAYLYRVTFNAQTRLQGANLSGADLSPDLRAFAERSGAIMTPRKTYNIKMMVEMEATARALQQYNNDGRYDDAISALKEAGQLFLQHPDYTYSDGLDQAFARFGPHPVWEDEVLECWDNVSKALAYYL